MLLVDANILIAILRTRDPKMVGLLRVEPSTVCGVTRAELLHGAQTPADRAAVVTALRTLRHVRIPDIVWSAAGDNLALCKRAGFSVPFNDGVLASLAIAFDVPIWSRDKHFPMMQRVLPALRLFVEPP